MDKLVIQDIPLKSLLSFFEGNDAIKFMELGDTWHPAEGFVDESYFKDIKTVNDLLVKDYDFKGLILFRGQIGPCIINYDGEKYRLMAPDKEIEKLKQKLRMNGTDGWQ